MVALGIPALLLYLRIVLAIAANRAGGDEEARVWLMRASYLSLGVFVVVQLVCARYVQRLVRPVKTRVARTLQYAGVLALCVFLSISGAIACESFGYAVFLRLHSPEDHAVRNSGKRVKPPQANSVWPVMYEPSSEAKNANTTAISSASPGRPIGM